MFRSSRATGIPAIISMPLRFADQPVQRENLLHLVVLHRGAPTPHDDVFGRVVLQELLAGFPSGFRRALRVAQHQQRRRRVPATRLQGIYTRLFGL